MPMVHACNLALWRQAVWSIRDSQESGGVTIQIDAGERHRLAQAYSVTEDLRDSAAGDRAVALHVRPHRYMSLVRDPCLGMLRGPAFRTAIASRARRNRGNVQSADSDRPESVGAIPFTSD